MFVIFTVAPGRTPSLSRTVPEIVPRVSWAPAGMAPSQISSIQVIQTRLRIDRLPPPGQEGQR